MFTWRSMSFASGPMNILSCMRSLLWSPRNDGGRCGLRPRLKACTRSVDQMVAQQPAVAGNTVVALEHAQARPQAHGIVGQNRLAKIVLESLGDAHREPVAARHDDGLRVRPVGAPAELIGPFRIGPAELEGHHEPHQLAVYDLETVLLHELEHGRVRGLAPGRADGELYDTQPP